LAVAGVAPADAVDEDFLDQGTDDPSLRLLVARIKEIGAQV